MNDQREENRLYAPLFVYSIFLLLSKKKEAGIILNRFIIGQDYSGPVISE
jgi:hypothetical protein